MGVAIPGELADDSIGEALDDALYGNCGVSAPNPGVSPEMPVCATPASAPSFEVSFNLTPWASIVCCCSRIIVSKMFGALPVAGALRDDEVQPPARDRGKPASLRSKELGLESSLTSGDPRGVFWGDNGGVAGGLSFLGECRVCCNALIRCSSLYRKEFLPNRTHNSNCILDATLTSTAGHKDAANESNLELDPSSDQVGLAILSGGCTSLSKSSNVSSSSISLCLCSAGLSTAA
mmetsp:Transcript_19193/g.44673  ORF Transcript_19193/g.44673 Transcript_19193/m.44673 type:complete len:235 (+) Transcript_19193:898-1602(+)